MTRMPDRQANEHMCSTLWFQGLEARKKMEQNNPLTLALCTTFFPCSSFCIWKEYSFVFHRMCRLVPCCKNAFFATNHPIVCALDWRGRIPSFTEIIVRLCKYYIFWCEGLSSRSEFNDKSWGLHLHMGRDKKIDKVNVIFSLINRCISIEIKSIQSSVWGYEPTVVSVKWFGEPLKF